MDIRTIFGYLSVRVVMPWWEIYRCTRCGYLASTIRYLYENGRGTVARSTGLRAPTTPLPACKRTALAHNARCRFRRKR